MTRRALIRSILFLTLAGLASAQQPTVHGLLVTWPAGTCPAGATCGATIGYNVMRSTTQGGPYTQVGQTTPAVTTFLDSTGVPGTTYFYVIQALATGAPPSQGGEASGVFPFPPAPVPGIPTVKQQ